MLLVYADTVTVKPVVASLALDHPLPLLVPAQHPRAQESGDRERRAGGERMEELQATKKNRQGESGRHHRAKGWGRNTGFLIK